MNPLNVDAELLAIARHSTEIRRELAREDGARAFVEAHAARLLKHAARLYAEACSLADSVATARALNRRAEIEQALLDAAAGKTPLPDAAQCRAWALRLGQP